MSQRVRRAVTASVIGLTLAAGAAGAYLVLGDSPARRGGQAGGVQGDSVAAGYNPSLSVRGFDSVPLPPGTPSPAFEAAGWLNGAPVQPGKAGLIVLDIWSDW